MVREKGERAALNKITEMADGGMGCQKFPVKSRILDLVSSKADCMAEVHTRAWFLDLPAVALKRGSMMMERCGTKRL